MDQNSSALKLYSEVHSVPVEWLWYPYIPSGKITILQGDPGDGKSTMMMNLIACLTNAGITPSGQRIEIPQRVIYQCSEDGVVDTIKPRLEASGADCTRVAFVDEELESITLDDGRLREAITEFGANMLVIDPFQAYLGEGGDITNVKKARQLMQKLSIWAATYNCAIVLIGHMTKNESSKDLYRGIGSIDLVAAARSVLQVCRDKDNPDIRYVKHVKSSLAPKGCDIGFELSATGFNWLGQVAGNYEETYEEIDEDAKRSETKRPSKQEILAGLLKDELKEGPVKATDILNHFYEMGIGQRRLKTVKKIMGIKSVRRRGQWYWEL